MPDLHLDLPPEAEAAVRALAKAEGVPAEVIVHRAIAQALSRPLRPSPPPPIGGERNDSDAGT